MKTLAIIGSGHLGQQIAHFAINDGHYNEVIFFDDFNEDDEVNGFIIKGNTSLIENSFKKNVFDELIIGVGYNHMDARKRFHQKFILTIPFATIVHSSSIVDSTAILGPGTIVYPGSIIDANVIIKDNILINVGCAISHDTIIEPHCFLSPSVALAGFVHIGEQCVLGINSTVIDNIKIANNVQIGGGTVVIKNIEKSGLYVGNPARFIRPNKK